MKRARKFNSLMVLGVGALGVAFFTGRVWAGGIPASSPVMTYSGVLQDGTGKPVMGEQNIEVRLWPTAAPGAPGAQLCTSGPKTITPDVGGHFSIALDECLAAVKANPELYAEVIVGTTHLAFAKLGVVPYAVEAAHATASDTAVNAAAGGGIASAISALQEQVNSTVSRVSLHDVGAFSPASYSFGVVPYVTETIDDLNEYDVDSGRFTAKAAGDYQICASLEAKTDFELDVFVNGARRLGFASSAPVPYDDGSGTILHLAAGCTVIRLAASDYADVRVDAYSPAPPSVTTTIQDWLTISRLR